MPKGTAKGGATKNMYQSCTVVNVEGAMKKPWKPRMVPRMVKVSFQWALTGEPVTHEMRARPSTKVSWMLRALCAATGLSIEETRLVFNGKCLRTMDTLARSGLQGQVLVGVVQVDPWEDVSSWLSKPPCTPSDAKISAVKSGDCVKIIAKQTRGTSEAFWTIVVSNENGIVRATVDNALVSIGWPVGKRIRFPVDRVYKIHE